MECREVPASLRPFPGAQRDDRAQYLETWIQRLWMRLLKGVLTTRIKAMHNVLQEQLPGAVEIFAILDDAIASINRKIVNCWNLNSISLSNPTWTLFKVKIKNRRALYARPNKSSGRRYRESWSIKTRHRYSSQKSERTSPKDTTDNLSPVWNSLNISWNSFLNENVFSSLEFSWWTTSPNGDRIENRNLLLSLLTT